ncbi:MAG: translation initiation factor IF-2 [Spirochaetales bacterium]|nr:translation initiation factor IF-2 [Spirochaetales bacterium]
MAEDQDIKPKATLIKHRKPAEKKSDDDAAKTEKKKVVVVKKKVVVKKQGQPGGKPKDDDSSKHIVARKTNSDNARKGHDIRPAEGRSPYRSNDRGGDQRRTGRRPGTGTGQRPDYYRDRGGRSQGPSDRSGGPGRPGQQNRRGPATGRKPQDGNRKGPRFEGRPKPGGFTPPPAEAEKKQGGKKFFKSKKKVNYQRKNDAYLEKNFQIKKKQDMPKTNPVPKEIDIMEVITVSELAKKMNLKASELISKLMAMGMMVTINEQIDAETAQLIAGEYDCKVKIVSLYDETIIESEKGNEEDLKPRPPIVTIMGHVDHGKTKLLDAIRKTNVVAGEFGGITQHIGAYKVEIPGGGEVVFLDTPGHEAFTLMRARGAQVTDIVVLVVAANDGVMPQTIEAINHAKDADVPIIVAVNKMDLPEANPERVMQQLSEYQLIPEAWGGNVIFQHTSALKGEGIKELLDAIMLQAEMLELKANYNCRAEGKIIESKVDHGRGIVASVIIERGTLKVGDSFVAGIYPGKVRAMFNDKGQKLDEAGPVTPVEILGFTGVPNSGDPFQVTESDKLARQIGVKRQELEKHGEAMNVKKVTLDNLYDSIQDGEVQELNIIIKGDVHGSVEALRTALEKLSTPEIRISVKNSAAGAIVENDVNFAIASNAIIVGFHVRPTPKAQALADQEKVEIRKYNIIYDAVEDIRSAMEGLLAPELKEVTIGTVEVRETFKVPKIGVIAGSYVTDGTVKRNAKVRVFRDSVEIHNGQITSLKRFKDDARQVEKGYECGIGIDDFDDLQVGDILEVFEIKEIAKKLSK